MGKYGITKSKIIKMISQGTDTLSEISAHLNLAPSTVSKHLHDLESAGIIRLNENEHIKKWKHYSLNEVKTQQHAKFYENGMPVEDKIHSSGRVWLLIGLIAVAIAGISYEIYSNQKISLPIYLTDPPQVPTGTQALNVKYSSVSLLINKSPTNKYWLTINSSGAINLISIINATAIIGKAELAANVKISKVRFNISSANITINNVTYPVSLASNSLIASLNNSKVNASSELVLDFSPIIVPAFSFGTLQFVMLPSLSAAMGATYRVGNSLRKFPINIIDKRMLHMPVFQQRWFSGVNALEANNITMNFSNGTLLFGISIRNIGGKPLNLLYLGIFGNSSKSQTNCTIVSRIINSSIVLNMSEINNRLIACTNSILVLPNTTGATAHSVYVVLNNNDRDLQMFWYERMPISLGFKILQNATLCNIINGECYSPDQTKTGYDLGAGSTVVLEYNGTPAIPSSMLQSLIDSKGYTVVVVTNQGVDRISNA
ncbi:MAG: ArsR family transcriptional regulator [Candidatus Micrarchaeaceae archaeon]